MGGWRPEPPSPSATERRAMPAVTTEQVESRVVEALTSFGADPEQISRESTFEELAIDSLDLVELAQIVEDEYVVVLKGGHEGAPDGGRRGRFDRQPRRGVKRRVVITGV